MSASPQRKDGRKSAKSPAKKASKGLDHNVHQTMNIHHFEQLMAIFRDEGGEDGGFSIDEFRRVFGMVFRGSLSDDQMTMLFMKIDANSDGSVSWDEFSTYMMMGSINAEETSYVMEPTGQPFQLMGQGRCHRDMIKYVAWVVKERKYISVSRDGMVGIWSSAMQLTKAIDLRDNFIVTTSSSGSRLPSTFQAWVTDAAVIEDQSKLAVCCDNRRVYFFDVLSLKPRLLAVIGPMGSVPLSLHYHQKYDDQRDLLLWGDDGGNVNSLFFNKRFFIDNVTEDRPAEVDPVILGKLDNQLKYHMKYSRRKVHSEASVHARYYPDLNSFISSSSDPVNTLVVGETERKVSRSIRCDEGISCFEVCARPSFLVTGGRDKIVRLWNPYVLNKPAGMLTGHLAAVTCILMNHASSHIISISEDKVVKIWSARTLQCLQTLHDKVTHRPENFITAATYDITLRRLILAHEGLTVHEHFKEQKSKLIRTHVAPVVGALYNSSFKQVVSASVDGGICVWNLVTGEKIFQFRHSATVEAGDGGGNSSRRTVGGGVPADKTEPDADVVDLTCISFDDTNRRLITGSRLGVAAVWNFNNGQMLQKMLTNTRTELTRCMPVQVGGVRGTVAVGWEHGVSVFKDIPGDMSTTVSRYLDGRFMGEEHGHKDDILAADYFNGLLATASVDGKIVVWSFESGHVRATMQDPFLQAKSAVEKAVEVVKFLVHAADAISEHGNSVAVPLISGHADGFVRFWNVDSSTIVHEVSCQIAGREGVTSLTVCDSKNALYLVVGDTLGTVRVFDVTTFRLQSDPDIDYSPHCRMVSSWRAHVSAITCVDMAPDHQIILTASKDGSVRVWTKKGIHIGIFGQPDPWNLADETMFAAYPADVAAEMDMVAAYSKAAAKETTTRQNKIKERILQKMTYGPLGIDQAMCELVETEMKNMNNGVAPEPAKLRERVFMAAVAAKWKAHVAAARQLRQSALSNAPKGAKIGAADLDFFRLDLGAIVAKVRRQENSLARGGTVYHSLPIQSMEPVDLPEPPPTLRRMINAGTTSQSASGRP